MPYPSINGIDLYYEVHGEGPPLVLAHGVGGNHASWYQQVPFFSRFYQTLTLDQRGFGLTEDRNGLGRGGFVEDLRALIDHLGLSKVSLVAQSMGGSTCMGFTVKYPERVSALVMADTLVGMTLPEELLARQQTNSQATRDLLQLERVVSRSLPERDPAKAELYLQVASFNKQNANRFNTGGTPAEPITMEQVVAAAKTVPMLFLVGQEDILQPPDIVSAAAALVPGSELAIVQDAGHSVYWEQPEVFNHVVHAFLKKVLPRE
jgi:3-oxoadipate enol-lactonase